jgi:cobalt-zinc-cadmium efflux system protein
MREGNHHGDHGHEHGVSNTNERAVFNGFLITALFMLVEFVGGYVSGSLALTTDAIHMLVDTSALLTAWAGFYFGKMATSPRKTFGYQRFEVLASLSNSLLLLCLTFFVAYEAIERLLKPVEIMAMPMFIISVVGLVVNCLVFYSLNRGERDHLNIKGAILHVLGDLLGSIAAILAAIVIYFTSWTPIDSILSIFACLLVLNSAIRLFLNALNVLLEGVPPHIDITEMKRQVQQIPNVRGIEDIHVWEITSGKTIAMVTIKLFDEGQAAKTIRTAKAKLEENFSVSCSNVEIDYGTSG